MVTRGLVPPQGPPPPQYGTQGFTDWATTHKYAIPQGTNIGTPTNPYGLGPGLVSDSGMPYPGVSSLLDLLNNPGQMDPRQLQMSIADSSRGTQQSQQNAYGGLAARGFGGGGFADAVNAAIGQGGANQIGNLYAQNAQKGTDMQRTDLLNLLGGLVQGGNMDWQQIQAGVDANAKRLSQAEDIANRQNIFALISAGLGAASAASGGGDGGGLWGWLGNLFGGGKGNPGKNPSPGSSNTDPTWSSYYNETGRGPRRPWSGPV